MRSGVGGPTLLPGGQQKEDDHMSTNTFEYLHLCIGAYLLWCAITGTGKLYEAKQLKCSREKYKRVLSIMAALTAVCMIIDPILILTKRGLPGSPLSWVLWTLGMGGIVAMVVYNKKMVVKGAAADAGAAQTQQPARVSDPLRAAFEFDEPGEANEANRSDEMLSEED